MSLFHQGKCATTNIGWHFQIVPIDAPALIKRDDIWNRSKIQWCRSLFGWLSCLYLAGQADYIWLADLIIFVNNQECHADFICSAKPIIFGWPVELMIFGRPSWSYLFSEAHDICLASWADCIYLAIRADCIWLASWADIIVSPAQLIEDQGQADLPSAFSCDTSAFNSTDRQQTELSLQWISDRQFEMEADIPLQSVNPICCLFGMYRNIFYFFRVSTNSPALYTAALRMPYGRQISTFFVTNDN